MDLGVQVLCALCVSAVCFTFYLSFFGTAPASVGHTSMEVQVPEVRQKIRGRICEIGY
jgi:hypothetical protein